MNVMYINNISMNYGKIKALNNIYLTISKGLYGLLGENGAGKSSLIRIITGRQKPTNGEVIFNNASVKRNKEFHQALGYMPQNFKAPEDMRCYEYLTYVGMYKGLSMNQINENIDWLVNILNLNDHINKKIKNLSGGTLRRLGIAQAFINQPSFVILDEPTAGLDITERRNFRDFVSRYSEKNTVIISTHIVSDIEYIASDLILLKKGNVISNGKYKDQLNEIQGMVWECKEREDKILSLRKLVENYGGIITNYKGEDPMENQLRYISSIKLSDTSVSAIPNLNDYYLWKMWRQQ